MSCEMEGDVVKIRRRCRFLAFLYYELLILGVFTSLVHWFDAGDVYSYGRFVFFVFVPILFYRHFYQKSCVLSCGGTCVSRTLYDAGNYFRGGR